MSVITTVRQALIDRVDALLPNHQRMSDPYFLAKNTDSEYRQGWGIKMGQGVNTKRQISCHLILQKTFEIVLTRIVTGREMDHTQKELAEIALHEDLFLLIKDFESSPALGSNVVVGCDFENDSGVQFPKPNRDDILSLTAAFSVLYQENLN